ncbi:hypothetical protein, partial [Acinetobacter bereziniae]|uniref:hypothetical protein n=1 Tax=Acinetobacter bereziniae TaxID=106648 RepID=UPI002952D5DF
YGNTFIIMNDHICQLMVNHLNLNNDKDFGFLLIKSIKNGSITNPMRKLFHSIELNLIKPNKVNKTTIMVQMTMTMTNVVYQN